METNTTSPLIMDIPATQLIPNAANPRKTVGDVSELAASIKAQGLQQQLLVTPAGQDTDGKPLYRIVIGHRRYQACIKAGMTMIPCTVRHLTDREEREIMLVENTQRADLTPIEEADGYQGLLDLGASIDELADKTGRSTSFVRRRIKIAGIPQATREKAKDFSQLTLSQLDALAEFADDPKTQARLAEKAESNDWRWELENARDHKRMNQWRQAADEYITANHLHAIKVKNLWTDMDGYGATHAPTTSKPFAESWEEYLNNGGNPASVILTTENSGYGWAEPATPKDPANTAEVERLKAITAKERERKAKLREYAATSYKLRAEWIRKTSADWTGQQMRDAIQTLARLETIGTGTYLPNGLDANQRDQMITAYNQISGKPLPDEKKNPKEGTYHLDTTANLNELRRRADKPGQELRQLTLVMLARQEARITPETWDGTGYGSTLKTTAIYYQALAWLGYQPNSSEQNAINGSLTTRKDQQ
ncbi:ParB/RepB/Spo0J family partition protein [Bifidobacterium imperatoris]|uniref:Chromosome partitioning protein ParB n=1 Tax=Bifidobacterium imperatoris TaxID=2020965 RepID=A0A2N5IQK0_9BIFI|nr:ParB/RepB/Spo0J family partition protein [Bifidobacterium imperatoris]PLS24238.1 chromosome partitioning protein ParB [Bifidobacterium imperatoris]QSY57269.1 ParB/RepB/Spo0J family partition protein [Bifidobacterium imperatoris]